MRESPRFTAIALRHNGEDMAKKTKSARTTTTSRGARTGRARKAARRQPRKSPLPRIPTLRGADRRDIGGVRLEVGRAGDARVKRMMYPAGFRWSVDMKPIVGTDLCMHAHVGFLEQGQMNIRYADGCVVKHKAPQVVAIEPGHDGWVVGKEPVVLIEFDFEGD